MLREKDRSRLVKSWARGDKTVAAEFLREAVRRGEGERAVSAVAAALELGDPAIIPVALRVLSLEHGWPHPYSDVMQAYLLAYRTRHLSLQQCGAALVDYAREVIRVASLRRKNPRPVPGAWRALRLGYETARMYGDVHTGLRSLLTAENGYRFVRRNLSRPAEGEDTPEEVASDITALACSIATLPRDYISEYRERAIITGAYSHEQGLATVSSPERRLELKQTLRESLREALDPCNDDPWLREIDGRWVLVDEYFQLPALAAPTEEKPFWLFPLHAPPSFFTDLAAPLLHRVMPSLVERSIINVEPIRPRDAAFTARVEAERRALESANDPALSRLTEGVPVNMWAFVRVLLQNQIAHMRATNEKGRPP